VKANKTIKSLERQLFNAYRKKLHNIQNQLIAEQLAQQYYQAGYNKAWAECNQEDKKDECQTELPFETPPPTAEHTDPEASVT
jgi:hypothetical protein